METDVSGSGLGAALAQEQENGLIALIAFASRTLQKHEQHYGVTELEAQQVVWATKHFCMATCYPLHISGMFAVKTFHKCYSKHWGANHAL